MPVQSCSLDGKSGYKFGKSGKCYTYEKGNEESKDRAYKKAVKQGQAEHTNYKYIKNYVQDDNCGTIYLYGPIGDIKDENGKILPGVNGNEFANEMDILQKQYPKINVRINSTGGSVIEGYAIFNSILTSKVPVDIYIDGMCASMAGVIAMAGDCVYMNDYAILMLHNPHGGGDQSLLDLLKSTLVTMISKRSGLSAEDVDSMMNETTWLTSKEAKEKGLIDIIVETDERESVMEELEEYELNNSLDLMNIYNVFNKKINKSEMENKKEDLTILAKIKAMLNKAKDADEMEVEDDNEEMETMDKLKNELKELKKSNKEMADKLDSYDKADKMAKEKEVKDLVNSYLESKTIKEEEVESITNLLNIDLAATKKLLDKSKINVGEPTRITNQIALNTISNNIEGKQDWDYLTWTKKDPKGLEEMRNSNKELFASLVSKAQLKNK